MDYGNDKRRDGADGDPMKFLRSLLCICILAFQLSPVAAWRNGFVATVQVNPALSGVVGFSPQLFPFVNFAKSSNISAQNTNVTYVYPNFLAQGTNLPTGGPTTGTLGYGLTLPSNYFGEYVFAIHGTVSGGSGYNWGAGNLGNFGQVYALGAGTTITGCSNGNVPPCFYQNSLQVFGTNPTVTMDFTAPITGAVNNGSGLVRLSVANVNLTNGQVVTTTGVVGSDGNGCGANGPFTLSNRTATTVDLVGSTFNTGAGCTYTSGGQLFPFQQTGTFGVVYFVSSGASFSGMTSLCFAKLADYNTDNTCQTTSGKTAWAGGFNDDFVSAIATLKPSSLRYLDVQNSVFQLPNDYNGWQTTSAFSYNLAQTFFAMTNWFGSDTTNSSNYAVTCVSPCTYTLTSGAPQDGDFAHFYLLNANTTRTPTLTLTDANSVTSSPIPVLLQTAAPLTVMFGGTATAGDTIALQFSTTPLGAYTCIAGGTHTTTPYTVLVSDTPSTIDTAVFNIMAADTALTALPQNIAVNNGGASFSVGYANNACTVTVTPIITGSATETVTTGTMNLGNIGAKTIYTAVYSKLLGAFLINNLNNGGQQNSWPWIVQIQLAQDVSTKSGVAVGCWLQPNLLWSNASFTQLANLAAANPCPGGTIFELSNEVWNATQQTSQARFLAASVGITLDTQAYYQLKQRQFWEIAQTAFVGQTGNLHTLSAQQGGGASVNELSGTTLCGTGGAGVCSNNWGYQNAIGVNYNSAPNRPVDFIKHLSEAPYYQGSLIGTNYGATFATWSATGSSVSANVLTIGTPTGTIWWNQGVSSCDGVYISPSNLNDPSSAQLTGKVTTTLNGAVAANVKTWVLTSVTGLLPGMWVYDQTNGLANGTILSINGGTKQITITAAASTYASVGANDTLVFGGLAGTYQLNNTTCSAGSGTITGGDVLGMQYAADNFNGINGALGSQADAFNWLYTDTLNSSRNNSMPSAVTIQSWMNLVRAMTSVANTFGLSVWDYEGGFQSVPPTTAQATTLGLSTTYGGPTGFIGLLLTAFKNNVAFQNLETLRHNNQLALEPAGSKTMWYDFETNSQWALYPSNLYNVPPYKSYNAICNYNGGSC